MVKQVGQLSLPYLRGRPGLRMAVGSQVKVPCSKV